LENCLDNIFVLGYWFYLGYESIFNYGLICLGFLFNRKSLAIFKYLNPTDKNNKEANESKLFIKLTKQTGIKPQQPPRNITVPDLSP
jgi:hypothetical protein